MYHQGYTDALRQLGMEKTAINLIRNISRFGPSLRNIGSSFATNLIGKPKQFYRELKGGTAFGRKGVLASGFEAPKLWQKGLMYGLPGVEAVQTMRSTDPNKLENLGGLAGGTLLGTAAFGPGGMVGALAGDALGRSVGSRAVRGARSIFGIGKQPVSQYTSLQ